MPAVDTRADSPDADSSVLPPELQAPPVSWAPCAAEVTFTEQSSQESGALVSPIFFATGTK